MEYIDLPIGLTLNLEDEELLNAFTQMIHRTVLLKQGSIVHTSTATLDSAKTFLSPPMEQH